MCIRDRLSATHQLASESTLLNVGYFVLQSIYHDLQINSFFQALQAGSKLTFDCNTINRFLTFARILEPRSKLGTFERLSAFYEQPAFEYQHILRFMDMFEEHYDDYLAHLFINSRNVVKRNTSVSVSYTHLDVYKRQLIA